MPVASVLFGVRRLITLLLWGGLALHSVSSVHNMELHMRAGRITHKKKRAQIRYFVYAA